MSPVAPSNLTGALASECRRLAEGLADMEGVLIDHVAGTAGCAGLLRELQTIDATQQTLADLAGVLDRCAQAGNPERWSAASVLGAIRQHGLRCRIEQAIRRREDGDLGRLNGDAGAVPSPDVELW